MSYDGGLAEDLAVYSFNDLGNQESDLAHLLDDDANALNDETFGALDGGDDDAFGGDEAFGASVGESAASRARTIGARAVAMGFSRGARQALSQGRFVLGEAGRCTGTRHCVEVDFTWVRWSRRARRRGDLRDCLVEEARRRFSVEG